MLRLLSILVTAVILCSAAFAKGNRVIELHGGNSAFLSDSINIQTVNKDIAEIVGKRAMLPLDQTLYIIIPSYGGDVGHGYQLAKFISSVPNAELICIYCASMAAAIFEMSGQKRLITKNSTVMLHEMKINATAASLTPQFVEEVKKSSDDFDKIFYTTMGWKKEKYESTIRDTEMYLIGVGIIKHKLADEIVKLKCNDYVKLLAPNTCKE